MPASRAANNPDILQFESQVVDVTPSTVALDETYFYPRGGGQPADTGRIEDRKVLDVRAADGTVRHELESTADIEAGDDVMGQIDPAFRTYCRRAHTASHVLYGAGRRLFDDLGYGGFDIDEQKVRVDLRTSSTIDDAALVELERLSNRTVWDARPVSWEAVPRDVALNRDDVAFNAATEEGVMSDADTIRVVEIDDWDVAACGGTHVRNTLDIGPITVFERSNPGEGLTRIEFGVGPTAIQHRADERSASLDAATQLGVPATELGGAVADLQDRLEALNDERDSLQAQVLDTALQSLDTVDCGDEEWRVGTVSGFGPNDVGDRIRDVSGDLVAVAGQEGSTFLVVVSRGQTAADALIEEVTASFGGGGGGDAQFAQGGGLDAAPDEVIAALLTD